MNDDRRTNEEWNERSLEMDRQRVRMKLKLAALSDAELTDVREKVLALVTLVDLEIGMRVVKKGADFSGSGSKK